MANTLVKIDVHLIFHVKSTSIKLQNNHLPDIFAYLGGIIKNIGGLPIVVGGRPDHIHILTTLPKTMSMADFARAVKADSSKWIRKIAPCYQDFAWQEGYGAFSVSPTLIAKTTQYIQNQEGPVHDLGIQLLLQISDLCRRQFIIADDAVRLRLPDQIL